MMQRISRLSSCKTSTFGVPLLVVALALPALRPLMMPGFLKGDDNNLHLFRFVEFHRLVTSGDFFPRWF
ncbi:MAG: hypothetical protein Q7O66_19675, partial [Dehalococcoidia bacterium]|nr:hypothetical protein [Dehalococcoidia bacterium]